MGNVTLQERITDSDRADALMKRDRRTEVTACPSDAPRAGGSMRAADTYLENYKKKTSVREKRGKG